MKFCLTTVQFQGQENEIMEANAKNFFCNTCKMKTLVVCKDG